MTKVANLAVAAGTWTGSIVRTGAGETRTPTLVVNTNGEITSASTGLVGPITGRIYSDGVIVAGFVRNGDVSGFTDFQIRGILSGNMITGTVGFDDSVNTTGTISLTR